MQALESVAESGGDGEEEERGAEDAGRCGGGGGGECGGEVAEVRVELRVVIVDL